MTTYYLLDARNLTYRELRRATPSVLAFLPLALLKFVRFPLLNNVLIPLIDRLHEVDGNDLPAEARDALAAPAAGWERLGFRRVCVWKLPLPQKLRFAAGVLLLAPDRLCFANVTYIRRPDGRFVWTPVYSLFRDGTIGMTTNQKHELDDPPTVLRSQQPAGAAPGDLWDAHRENLAGTWAGFEAEPLGADGARATAVEMERREVEYMLARGVVVPASDADYDRLADPDE